MAIRKIKSSWWVDFRSNHKRFRIRSPQNTKGGAEAYEAHLRSELAQGKKISNNANSRGIEGAKPFQDFALEWLQSYALVNNKPSEQNNKRHALNKHLLPFFRGLTIKEITSHHVERFKAKLQANGLKAKSINNVLAILRKCLATAEEWGALENVPKIKPLKAETPKYKFLSEIEEERLLGIINDPFWKTMIVTALKTGMRYSELIALEWEDVNLETKSLCVRRANVRGHIGTPKNNKMRYIPLTDETVGSLKTLQHFSGLVFPYQGSWMRYEVGRLHLGEYCRKAGIQAIAWHALRHTFASRLVSAGAPLKAVQDLMGHSTINMTMRYSHMNQQNLRDAISLLELPRTNFWATRGQPDENIIKNLLQNIVL